MRSLWKLVEADGDGEDEGEAERTERRVSPLVYCVHGNRWGLAQCCEELEQAGLDILTRNYKSVI